MEIGISSSCFYPMTVEDSLKAVGELGARTAEIFMNSFSEVRRPILAELRNIRDYYGLEIRSLHPFTSAYETILIFSDYERRTNDSTDFYKMYFEAAAELGAQLIVLHGGRSVMPISAQEYANRYMLLNDAAKQFGVRIAHENVNNCHCADPNFMRSVSDYCGGDFSAVLDIKQCRRAEHDEYRFIELLGDKICQVHLSDFTAQSDCALPGSGEYDFAVLFTALKNAGYDKSAVIELYRNNFNTADELKTAMQILKKYK